ncbi:MAG: hypothetical protein JO090_03310 [Rhizobacter sp.]|nr:hypothetical protein [Rhizobacter sp.]
MTCCAARRSRPNLFVAIVALSAVAFIGQAFATPAPDATTAIAALALGTQH